MLAKLSVPTEVVVVSRPRIGAQYPGFGASRAPETRP